MRRAPVLTQGNHQEAHVPEPVGRLIGQLGDEEAQDGPQVALPPHRGHLHRPGNCGIAVTAANTREGEVKGLIFQGLHSRICH